MAWNPLPRGSLSLATSLVCDPVGTVAGHASDKVAGAVCSVLPEGNAKHATQAAVKVATKTALKAGVGAVTEVGKATLPGVAHVSVVLDGARLVRVLCTSDSHLERLAAAGQFLGSGLEAIPVAQVAGVPLSVTSRVVSLGSDALREFYSLRAKAASEATDVFEDAAARLA